MLRPSLAVLFLALPFAGGGCTGALVSDIIAVPARPPEPPPVTAFRSTLGEAALSLTFIGPFIQSDGTVAVLFSDGSRLEGTVDTGTGEFDLLLTLPAGYYLVSVSDVGRFELDGGGYIVGGVYREEYSYITGARARWDVEFEWIHSMDLHAVDVDRGTQVSCLVRFLQDQTSFAEKWDLMNGYHEEILTVYHDRDPFLTQDWTRDERATAVSPDRAGSFELAADGSGQGRLEWYYDHGITSIYEIHQAADGSAQASLVYEDPGTQVSPDGVGAYTFGRDHSGTGTYTEQYDDGSALTASADYGSDDSFDEVLAFDHAATAWAPDADGESHTAPDSSGSGTWRRYDASGVVETCRYEFDTTATITSLDCS